MIFLYKIVGSDSKGEILIKFTYQPDTVKGPNLFLIGYAVDTQPFSPYYSFGRKRAPIICDLIIFTRIAATWGLLTCLLG